jgi:nucleoside-diphosphate-sugar epimerase
VGEAAAHALISRDWRVIASMHTKREDAVQRLRESGATVRYDDIEHAGEWAEAAATCDAFVFATHLRLTNAALARITAEGKHVVAFSSNNVAIQPEAAAYAELAAAERTLRDRRPDAAIIRPTLIYGDPRLPTLTRVMRMARRWPVVPMPGSGRALLQPVFHDDLGRAAAWLADGGAGGTYAIGGPDAVKMRTLIRATVRAVGSKAPVMPIPSVILRVGGPLLSLLRLYSPEQTLRADRDRLPVQQTPLPQEIVAKVGLKEGLARLALALSSVEGGLPAGGR